MEFSIYKSKITLFVIFIGLRWFYRYYCFSSNGSGSNQGLDEEETTAYNHFSLTSNTGGNNPLFVSTTATLQKGNTKVATDMCKKSVAGSLPHLVVEQDKEPHVLSCDPKLEGRVVAAAQKISFGSRKFFFKNALLMHELIKRKDFVEIGQF